MERVRHMFPCLKLNIIKLKHPPQPLRLHPSKVEAMGGGRQEDHAPWTHVEEPSRVLLMYHIKTLIKNDYLTFLFSTRRIQGS